MPERKGSAHARALFQKALDSKVVEEWKMYDQSYDRALQILSEESKRSDLVDLDVYVHQELPTNIHNRSPAHLIHAELAQIMKWKLTRGKFRPLQKLVESNTSISVIDASSQSFQLLAQGNWEGAFDAITQLRGVGVATASAICSLIAPHDCPFMADEVLEGVTSETREYSMRAYSTMRQALIDKASALEEGWTADRVGRALWTCAIISAHQQTGPAKKRAFPAAAAAADSTAPTTSTITTTSTTTSTTTKERAVKRGAEAVTAETPAAESHANTSSSSNNSSNNNKGSKGSSSSNSSSNKKQKAEK